VCSVIGFGSSGSSFVFFGMKVPAHCATACLRGN